MSVRDFSLWTALVTPLQDDLSVDFKSLKKLVSEQEEAGNGLLILGSTGEGLNIGLKTKKKIIKYVTGREPNVPVMAGVGGHDFKATRKWVRWLESQDVDAYLMVVPIYAKPGVVGQTEWFAALMDEVSRPVMLYNVPSRTGKALELKAVDNLKSHKHFWGIKEASGSVDQFKQYLDASDGAMVYCGDDALFPDFAAAGSSGLVSVASNPWPHQTNLYVEQGLVGTFEDRDLWTKAADSLFSASNPIPAKRLLQLKNRIQTDRLMPPLSARDLTDNSDLLTADTAVNEWYEREI